MQIKQTNNKKKIRSFEGGRNRGKLISKPAVNSQCKFPKVASHTSNLLLIQVNRKLFLTGDGEEFQEKTRTNSAQANALGGHRGF